MGYDTFLCVHSACGPSVTLPMRQQRAAAAAVGSASAAAQFELVEVEVTEESSSSIIPLPPPPQRARLNRGSSLLAPSTLVRQKCMRQRPSAVPTPAAGSAGVSRTNSMRRLQAWVVTQSPPYRRQSKTMQSND